MYKLQWQGEPVNVEFGECTVTTKKDKPLWWYNFECRHTGSACIPAIKVITKSGHEFLLANHFGIATHKLLNGGWPNETHFSLDGNFHEKPENKAYKLLEKLNQIIVEFQAKEFSEYESERDKWFKDTYPTEWQKMQGLKSMISSQNMNKNQIIGGNQ